MDGITGLEGRFTRLPSVDNDEELLDLSAPNGVLRPATGSRTTSRWRQWWEPKKAYLAGTRKGTVILVLLSVTLLLVGVGISLGLGYIAYFQQEKPVYIDKSIQAFNIPSHEAMKRYDALELAKDDAWKSLHRGKRSLDSDSANSPFQPQKQDLSSRPVNTGGTSIQNSDDRIPLLHSVGNYISNIIPSDLTEQDDQRGWDSEYKALKGLRKDYYEDKASRQPLSEYIKAVLPGDRDEEDEGRGTDAQLLRRQKRSYIQQSYLYWRLELVFLARGGDNIFTADRLEKIHQVEQLVTDHPQYADFCYKSLGMYDPIVRERGGCAPINSLLTYFYPTQRDKRIYYNGFGDSLEPINKTLLFAMNQDSFYWYTDDQINKNNLKSRLLRSEAHFGMPLPGYLTVRDRRDEQLKAYRDFIISYVDVLSKQSDDKVEVLFGSSDLYDYQVDRTFWHDIRLATYAAIFIALLMFVLTSFSIWLTVFGMVAISLSLPLSLFFYRVVCKNDSLGILNGAAAFLIIGIGVDDVFVFINTFQQADHMNNIVERLLHTLRTAGKATFFTSFTTSAAFAANIASAIPAIHGFGLFMSLIVACCWLTVVIVMPPAIYLWFLVFARCENAISSLCRCGGKKLLSSWQLPADIQRFLEDPDRSKDYLVPEDPGSCESPTTRRPKVRRARPTDGATDDEQLILMDDVQDCEGGINDSMNQTGDDPLLVLEKELEGEEGGAEEGCGLTRLLQVALYRYVVCPVVRARWVILGVYLVVLVVSCGLVSQLRPASKPPQLFKSETNLQQLLDLTYNFSDTSIRCDRCSGAYKETPVNLDKTGSTPTPTPWTNRQQWTPAGGFTERGAPAPPSSSAPFPAPGVTSAPRVTQPLADTTQNPVVTPAPTRAVVQTTKLAPQPGTTKPLVNGATAVPSPTRAPQIAETTRAPQVPFPAQPTPAPLEPSTAAHTPPMPAPGSVTTQPKPAPGPEPQPQPTQWRPEPAMSTSQRETAKPPDTKYDPCADGKCSKPKERPNLEIGAAVYVVFGIRGVDRSNVSAEHVLTDKGQLVYDPAFQGNLTIGRHNQQVMRDLCMLCKLIANNTQLVKAGSGQCMPDLPYSYSWVKGVIDSIPECSNLPGNQNYQGRRLSNRAMVGMETINGAVSIKWLAFAFESTTFKGQGYFAAYAAYQRWDKYLRHLKDTVLPKDSPLQDMYQTSEFWKNVMMEVVAVTSAIYGLLLSLIICVAAVTVFTGHILLLLIILFTIAGVICLVVSIFYMAGWEMGAVEAVSLSILVGSSVDYCVHLVEGYILAGENPPAKLMHSNALLRQWRTKAAVSHIGVSIVSSAVTTIIAAIPLTQTLIQPFSKFGQIVAMNTSVAILYTLTICAALLAIMGPARYRSSLRGTLVALVATGAVLGLAVLVLYIVHVTGVDIPSPSGQNLFG